MDDDHDAPGREIRTGVKDPILPRVGVEHGVGAQLGDGQDDVGGARLVDVRVPEQRAHCPTDDPHAVRLSDELELESGRVQGHRRYGYPARTGPSRIARMGDTAVRAGDGGDDAAVRCLAARRRWSVEIGNQALRVFGVLGIFHRRAEQCQKQSAVDRMAHDSVRATTDELGVARTVIGIPQLRPRYTRAHVANPIPTGDRCSNPNQHPHNSAPHNQRRPNFARGDRTRCVYTRDSMGYGRGST